MIINSKKYLALCLLIASNYNFLTATNVIIQSKQGKQGWAGLQFKNNRLYICANPNVVSVFNFNSKRFEDDDFTVKNFSFSDDIVLSPNGYSLASFLDGKVPTKFDNGTVVQSLTGPFEVATETGIFHEEFNSVTQGIDPIAFRPSNSKIYFQAFDPTILLFVDLLGSTTSSVALSIPSGLNGMQFGPDDKLYAVVPASDPNNPTSSGQIVQIDADNGNVNVLLNGLSTPIAAKVASNGLIYFVERTTANVYKFNPATDTSAALLVTVEPPLDNLCLNPAETKLYVTNNQNKIYEVEIASKKVKTLFTSPITQLWDIAYDPSTNSLYLGDMGILQQVDAKNGNPIPDRAFILDSDKNPFANGFGIIAGLDFDTTGTTRVITMADVTLGNILAINESDYSFHEFFSGFETGLFGRQNFSTVRITGGTPSEYYLALDAVGGNILKIFRNPDTSVSVEIYFSGLNTPVKLKKHNGSLYVVEAGQLNAGSTNTGRVSKLPIQDTPPTQEQQLVLLDQLNNPQGMDICKGISGDDILFVAEVGENQLIQGSATIPSIPTQVTSGLEFPTVVLVSSINPIPVDPFVGFACNPTGNKTKLYIVQKGTELLKIKIKKS